VSVAESREVIAGCTENHTKHTNTVRQQNAEKFKVKVAGAYRYHCAQQDQEVFRLVEFYLVVYASSADHSGRAV
jgi:hypothetical protein